MRPTGGERVANGRASAASLAERILVSEDRQPFDLPEWSRLRRRIAATPAAGLADIAAKIRVVLSALEVDGDPPDVKILRSALADLERLSGAG